MEILYNNNRALLKKGVILYIYGVCDKLTNENGDRFEFCQETLGQQYKETWEKILEVEINGKKRKMDEYRLNIPVNVRWVSSTFEEQNPSKSYDMSDYLNWKESDTKNLIVKAEKYGSSRMWISMKDIGDELKITKTYDIH